MRRRFAVTAALIAAAVAGGVLMATLAGGDEGPAPLEIEPDRVLEPLAVEPVADPPREALRGGSGQKLDFFQTQPLEIAAGTEEGATLPCPKGYKALSGYYVTGKPGTFLDLTAPAIAVPDDASGAGETGAPTKRSWVVAVFNTSAEPDQVVFGVGCLNKVK